MTRSLSLVALLFHINLMREMEYKASFFINSFAAIGWFVAALVSIQLLFLHTTHLAGWDRQQVFLLVGIYRVIEALANASFRINFERLPGLIQRGELDMVLTKPIPPQLLISFRLFRVFELPNVLVAVAIIIVSLQRLQLLSASGLLLGTFYCLVGLVILYSLWFAIAQVAFFSTRMTALWEIYNITHSPAMVPIQVYEGAVRLFLTIVVPVAFITTVPAQAFMSGLDMGGAIGGLILAAVFVLGSNQLFQWALRRYSSASS